MAAEEPIFSCGWGKAQGFHDYSYSMHCICCKLDKFTSRQAVLFLDLSRCDRLCVKVELVLSGRSFSQRVCISSVYVIRVGKGTSWFPTFWRVSYQLAESVVTAGSSSHLVLVVVFVFRLVNQFCFGLRLADTTQGPAPKLR